MHEPYENLANAIIVQACIDYRNALDGFGCEYKSPETVIKEIEKFFGSSYYRMLTKVKGEYLIARLKEEHLEKLRKEKLCKSH